MKKLGLLWMVGLSAALLAPPAAGQGAKGAARALADEGRKRFNDGDYQGALQALGDADKYFHAPTITLLRGKAYEKLDKLMEAEQTYKSVAEEKLAASSPAEWLAAKEEASRLQADVALRIPHLEISVKGASANSVRVTVDGAVFSSGSLGQSTAYNPGKYEIAGEAPGSSAVKKTVVLKERATEKVVLDFTPPDMAVTTAPVGSAPAEEPEKPKGRSYVGPIAAFGVGGAGLVLGVITGALSIVKVSELRSVCGAQLQCPDGKRGDVESSKIVAHVSTVGFVTAGVGAALGTVLLLLPSKKAPSKVGVAVGAGEIVIKGQF